MAIYVNKTEVHFALPQSVPTLDAEQFNSAMSMVNQRDLLLFSDPGAGKTLTALEAVRILYARGKKPKTVVLCPTIALRNWAIWSAKYLDISVQILTGNDQIPDPDVGMVICTFGTVGRKGALMPERLKMFMSAHNRTAVLIIDESDNLNGVDSNRTDAIFGPNGLANFTDYCWPMTGTPLPRYQDGLWPVLNCLFPKHLEKHGVETKKKFMDTFCRVKRVKYGKMRVAQETVAGNRNIILMNDLLYGGEAPIVIRNKLTIRATAYLKEITLDLHPSKELRALEAAALSEQEQETDAYGNPIEVVSTEMGAALHLYGQELAPYVADAVLGLLRKVDDGILVLFWHKAVGQKLLELLTNEGVSCSKIDGSTSMKARDEEVDRFNSGLCTVLIGQIKTMGVALNLQDNCHTVVFAEDTYSASANLQAYQRVYRRGQEKDVDVVFCKTLMPLADIRSRVADRKGSDAAVSIDGFGL